MVIWEPFVKYENIKFDMCKRLQGQRTKKAFADCVCAFDIETTRIMEIDQSFMFVWQFSIDNKIVILGRTWDEFKHMLSELEKRLNGLTLLIYVHNLSFEGQFLSGIYDFDNSEVFAMDSRKILKMTMYGCFEFRCSYRLFNMSLEAVTRKYNCQYAKRSGADFDYSKFRKPTTPLTHKELLYCVYDVVGLVEAVKAQLDLFGDNLYSVPYTQTGYVRREAKKLMRPYHAEIQNCFPSFECYHILRQAFRGGNTHASRYYVGDIIEDVHGNDVSSEYPAQQVLEEYPRHGFSKVGFASLTTRYIDKLINLHYALLIVVDYYYLELKDKYNAFPYISSAKAIGRVINKEDDNGRVMSCNYIRLALTDIDYKIVESQYKCKRVEVISIYQSKYGPMYDGIIELNKQLFKAKTELKGVSGQELYYVKSKEQLNAIYGMTVQNVLNKNLLFETAEGRYVPSTLKSELTLYEEAKRRAFLTYQLGVWTTAHARAELQKFIDRAGDSAIYCDTDSLMYVGDVNFSDFNEDYKQRCVKSGEGAYATDSKGNVRYMGVFESEDDKQAGYKYKRFITQGAKRYAFEKPNGEIGITVAGVSKKLGAKELSEKGGLEAFKPGLIFENCGKLEAVYRDSNYGEYELFNGEKIDLTCNVTLRPVTYELTHSKDYAKLLKKVSKKELQKALVDLMEQMHNY